MVRQRAAARNEVGCGAPGGAVAGAGGWSTPAKGPCQCLKLRCVRARRLLPPLALAAAFGLARGPLHAATFRLPVSNDDAILLLMGRHVLKGELATTLWNQPYNGALDAYLLAPLLAVLPHHDAYRLYQLLCAALLVVLAGLLARRLGGAAAGFAAALLAAWGTPYMALMTATGPPPNFLVPLVTGFPLVAALAWCGADPPGVAPRRAPGPGAALGFGLLCGLAVWCSSLAIPAFAGMAAGLALAGLRPRPARAGVVRGGGGDRCGAARRGAADRRVRVEGRDGVERGHRDSAVVRMAALHRGPRARARRDGGAAGPPRRRRGGACAAAAAAARRSRRSASSSRSPPARGRGAPCRSSAGRPRWPGRSGSRAGPVPMTCATSTA